MTKKYAMLNVKDVSKAIKDGNYTDIAFPFNIKILGRVFSVELTYTRGMHNPFNDEDFPRGFYIDVNNGGIGKDISETNLGGLGYSAQVNAVKRYSKKQDRIAHQTWGKMFLKTVNVLKAEIYAQIGQRYANAETAIDNTLRDACNDMNEAFEDLIGSVQMTAPDDYINNGLKKLGVSYTKDDVLGLTFNDKNRKDISDDRINELLNNARDHYDKLVDKYQSKLDKIKPLIKAKA